MPSTVEYLNKPEQFLSHSLRVHQEHNRYRVFQIEYQQQLIIRDSILGILKILAILHPDKSYIELLTLLINESEAKLNTANPKEKMHLMLIISFTKKLRYKLSNEN